MGFLIDDLLNLARATRAEMQVEPVDLTTLARHVAGRLQEAEPRRQMELQIQPGLAAKGDPRLLEVALTNLLSNAVKFTGPRARARIEFGQERAGSELIFHVRDNGVGFNMAYRGLWAGMAAGPGRRLSRIKAPPFSSLSGVGRTLRPLVSAARHAAFLAASLRVPSSFSTSSTEHRNRTGATRGGTLSISS